MAISEKMKERLHSAAKRSATLAKSLAMGAKGSALSAGAGAGAYYVASAAREKVEFLQKDYVLPAVMAVGGHFLKRKSAPMGYALIGIGGFLAAQTYDLNSKSSSTSTTPTKGIEGADGWGDDLTRARMSGGGSAGALGWTMMDGGNAGALNAGLEANRTMQATSQAPGGGWRDAGALVGEAGALYTD